MQLDLAAAAPHRVLQFRVAASKAPCTARAMASSAWRPPATILAPGCGVVVMSARPARIKLDRVVDQPHPRHCAMRTSPAYTGLKVELTGQVRRVVIAAQAL